MCLSIRACNSKFVADDMTFFEPEAPCQMLLGKEFHEFIVRNLFKGDAARASKEVRQEIKNPKVRFLGRDAAVIAYIRIYQSLLKYVSSACHIGA